MGFNLIKSATSLNEDILGLTMLVSGLFVTFFGAKYFKHLIFFVGFIIGGIATYFLVNDIFGWIGEEPSGNTRLYISLTVGALTGVLCVVVYKAAIFVCGAIGGVIVSQFLWQIVILYFDFPYKTYIQIGVLLGFAVLGGYLANKFVEFVLKGVTAFIGAFMFSSAVAYFIQRFEKKTEGNVIDWMEFFTTSSNYTDIQDTCDTYCFVCFALWAVLTVAGAAVQYKFHGKHDPDDYDDDVSESSEDEERPRKKRKKKVELARAAESDRRFEDGARYGRAAPSPFMQAGGGRPAPPSGGAPGYGGYNEGAPDVRYV